MTSKRITISVPEEVATTAQRAVEGGEAETVLPGELLAAAGTSDVTDAHVVLLARRIRGTVVTSDPDDVSALDSSVSVVNV